MSIIHDEGTMPAVTVSPDERQINGQQLPRALKHWINSIPKQSCALVSTAADLADGTCICDIVNHIFGGSHFDLSNAMKQSPAGRVRSAICVVADKVGWEALPPEFTDAQYSHLICSGGDSCSTYTVPFMDFLQSLDGHRRKGTTAAAAAMVPSPSDAALLPAAGSDAFPRSRSSQDRLLDGGRRDSSPSSGRRPLSYRVVSRLGQMTRPSARADGGEGGRASTRASRPHGGVPVVPGNKQQQQQSPLTGWREFDLGRGRAGAVSAAAVDWDPTTAYPTRRASGRSPFYRGKKKKKKEEEGELTALPSTSTTSSSSRPSPKMQRIAAIHDRKASQLIASAPGQSMQAGCTDPQQEKGKEGEGTQGRTGALSSDLAGSLERHIQCVLPTATDNSSSQRDSSRMRTPRAPHLLQVIAPLPGSDQRPPSECIPLDRMNAILRWIQGDLGISIAPINPSTRGNSATSIAVSDAADLPTRRSPFRRENLYHYRPELEEKASYTPGYGADQLGGFSVSTYLGHLSDATSRYLGHVAGRVVDQQQLHGRDAKGRPCSTGRGFLGDPWINGLLLAEVVAALSRLGGSKHAVKQIASYDRFGRQLEMPPRSVLRGVEVTVRSRAQAVHNIALCLTCLQQIPGFPCIDYSAKDIVDGQVSLWQLLSTVYDTCAPTINAMDLKRSSSSKEQVSAPRRVRAHSTAADEGGAKSASSPRPSSAPPAVGRAPPAAASDYESPAPLLTSSHHHPTADPSPLWPGGSAAAAVRDGSAGRRSGGAAVARVREAEMKEERRRARAIDRRHRLQLFNRAADRGVSGDNRAAACGADRGLSGDNRAAAVAPPIGKVDDDVVAAMDQRKSSSRRTKHHQLYLWSPPQLSAVEVETAKTAAYVPTISKSQQATVRQWLASLHIHLVDGEGGFVLGSVHADAQAVKAMRSVPTIPLAEDRMRNGDLYAQLLCVLEPDLALHAHIPRLLLRGTATGGGGSGGGVTTVEQCVQNLERVLWLIRLRMCPPIPLVYLCQPRQFLSGNRDLMWGLVWEMMQLYSTASSSSSSRSIINNNNTSYNNKPYCFSTDDAASLLPISDLRIGTGIGQVDGGAGLQRLPYSSSARRQLDVSLLHWLDECGLLREIGADLCRPSTVLSLESYLRDGTLLCLLVERCFMSALSSRVLHQWHWHRRPSTRHQCLINLRSCLAALRSCRHMGTRFLHAGMEESIQGGRWDCILGLLEDMHRCADGAAAAAVTEDDDDDREATPYLGKFPPGSGTIPVGAPVGRGRRMSPPSSSSDLRDRPPTSSLLHDVPPGQRSFDRTLHLDQFVVTDVRRDDDDGSATHLVEPGRAVDGLGGLPSADGEAIRSSFDLFPSIATAVVATAATTTEKEQMDDDDDDLHSKYRDRQLTFLDPSLSYSGLALPSDTQQAAITMIQQQQQQQQRRQVEDQDVVNQNYDCDDDGAHDDDDDDDDVEEGGHRHHHPLRDTLSPDSLALSPDSLGSAEEDSLQGDGDDVVQEEQLLSASSSPVSEQPHGATRGGGGGGVSSISLAILRFRQTKLLRWLQEEGVSPLPRPLPIGSHLFPADTFSDGVLLCDLVRRLERCGPLPGTHPRPACSTHRIQNVRRCLELLAERNRRIPLRELSCEDEVLRGDIDRTLDLFFSIRKGYRGGQGRKMIR